MLLGHVVDELGQVVPVGALALAGVQGLVGLVVVGTGDEGRVGGLARVLVERVGVDGILDVGCVEPLGDGLVGQWTCKFQHALKVEAPGCGC